MKRVVALTLVALALVACLTLYAIGSALMAPNPSRVGELPADLAGENVLIPSESGSVLHGWFVPGQSGAVVLFHGLHGSRRSMIGRARLLHEAGFSVLLFDFQANGESPGEHVTFGYLESRDARAAVDYVRRRLPGERVGALGMSMGGAAAILADPPLPVDALVVEAVYPSLDEAVADRLTMRFGRIGRTLTPLLTVQVRPRLGFRPGKLRPIGRVGALSMPKLFIAGSEDEHTRLAESEALFAAAARPKELWVVPGARHVDLYAYAPDEYAHRVVAFFQETLR